MKRIILLIILVVLSIYTIGARIQGSGGLKNDSVLEAHLKAVDSAVDEECLTYEVTTGDFEWQSCAGTETNNLETNDPPNVADAEVYVGTGAGTGVWISGLAACAADEKIEYVPGAPDTFTCEAIGSLVEADITDLSHTVDTDNQTLDEVYNQGSTAAVDTGSVALTGTLADNVLEIIAGADHGNSTSTGGALLITNTSNVGAGLVIYDNTDATADGRALVVRQDNVANDQQAVFITNDGTNSGLVVDCNTTAGIGDCTIISSDDVNFSTVGISGTQDDKGTVKITHNKPAGADTAASVLSLLANTTGTAVQGIFFDTGAGITTSGDLLNFRQNGTEKFNVDSGGLLTTRSVQAASIADADYGDFTFSSGVGTLDSGVVDSTAVLDDSIKAVDLDFTDTEADEECVTYEATGTAFESQVCNQPGKQTLWIPAAAMRPTVSNGSAALTDVETTAGRPDMTVLDFDATADEHAQFQIAFPKSWNLGTVTFQGFWTSAGAVTTGIALGMQCISVTDNTTLDVAYGTAVVITDDAQSAAEELYVTAESGAVTVGGTPIDDDGVFCRVFRDVSDANDDMTQDMRLIGIKLFYTTDLANDA